MTSTSLSRRTFARTAVRSTRPSRAARLRLDTLEQREQPGSVLDDLLLGVAGAGMLEPFQVMASMFGPEALTKDPAALPVPTSRPEEVAVAGLPLSGGHVEESEKRPVSGSEAGPAATATTSPTSPTAPPTVDVSDLSIAEPIQIDPPALRPAPTPEMGAPGGSAGGALPPTPTEPSPGVPFAGTPNDEGEAAPSLAEPAPATPAGGSTSPVAAAGVGVSVPAPPKDVFIAPPNDKPAAEPPATTQVRTASVPTTTNPIFAVGTDAGVTGQVKVYDALTRDLLHTLSPFPNSFHGGVRVAVADVTGDGTADVVTSQGPGGDNKVRIYNGATGKALTGNLGTFSAFTSVQANGVWVAAGDVTGDGKADLVVGTDGNFVPQAKVLSGANGSLVRTLDLSSLGLKNGVRVAAGDLNGDGKDEVIVGGGAGSPARVGAFDGGNGKLLYDYLPFGAGYFGGVNLSAGDATGDGYPDVIAGQASGGSMIKVYSGKDTSSVWNLEPFPGVTGGVRVGTVDANGDGKLDVLVGRAPGGGEVRAFAMGDDGQLFALAPFGANFDKGTFVAGDARPVGGVIILSHLPEVSITGHTNGIEGRESFTVTFARTGSTANSLGFTLSYGGTAADSSDYLSPLAFAFNIGQSSAAFDFNVQDDALPEGNETVVLTVDANPGISEVGTPGSVALLIADNDSPTPAGPAATTGGDSGCVDEFGDAMGSPRMSDLLFRPEDDSGGINETLPDYVDDPLMGLALAWSMVNTRGGRVTAPCGIPPWVTAAMGNFRGIGNRHQVVDFTTMAYVVRCSEAQFFDQSGGNYTARDGAKEKLSHDTGNKQFVFTDTTGGKVTFHDFDSTIPADQRGLLKSETDAAGNTVASATYNGSGQLTALVETVTTGSTTTTSTWSYSYLTSGANSGKLSTVTWTEQVGGGSAVTVRTGDLSWYDGTTSNGTLGDLRSFTLKDPSANVLEVSYFRTYTSNTPPGYTGGLKFQVTAAAYDRMAAWAAANSTTVDAMTDAQVAPFADFYLEYDEARRVTRVDVGAGGCSACSGGIGSYLYSYAVSPFADGYNSWRYKRTETQPDGTVNVTYANYVGAPILFVHQEGGQSWSNFWKYGTTGLPVLAAAPSAISGYDETTQDLLNSQSGNYQFLRDSQGLVRTNSYYSSTTATTSTAGGVAGYLHQVGVQRGETGTSVLQGTADYIERTANSITIYPIASTTMYRNTNGTGGQVTSYAWSWNTGSNEPASVTVTLPTVTTAQNGPNTATNYTVVADSYGRPVWFKDQGGFITHVVFDDATSAVTKVIEDVE